MAQCNRCKQQVDWYKNVKLCRECRPYQQREYIRTPQGRLMMTYHNMRCRVEGLQPAKAHLYAGLPIMPRAEFYAWALNDLAFRRLFRAWKRAGFVRRLSPSIHRIDRTQGYVPGNVMFVTQATNSSLITRRAGAA